MAKVSKKQEGPYGHQAALTPLRHGQPRPGAGPEMGAGAGGHGLLLRPHAGRPRHPSGGSGEDGRHRPFLAPRPVCGAGSLCRGPAGAGGDGPALSSGFVRRPAAGHPPSGDPQRLYPAGVLSGVVHGAVRGLLAGVPAGGPGGYGAGAGKRHGRDTSTDDGHRPSGGRPPAGPVSGCRPRQYLRQPDTSHGVDRPHGCGTYICTTT